MAKSTKTTDEIRADMLALTRIVREAGNRVNGMIGTSPEIIDTGYYKGHDVSSVDFEARDFVQSLIDKYLPSFEGTVRFETFPYRKVLLESLGKKGFLIIDEIDGTTNLKRALASIIPYRAHSAVTMAIGTGPKLADIYASAIFSLDQNEVWSAQLCGSGFNAYRNLQLVDPADIIDSRGDSKRRLIVAGYSNSHCMKRAEIAQTLWQCGPVYDGCRASTVDIINVICNAYDAYVDLRSFWSTKREDEETEAMLQIYDVAAVIPLAEACGLKVTDAFGLPWQSYGSDDTIPLVVARPSLHPKIIELISPKVGQWREFLPQPS